jgi:hypothetical protein
MTIPHATIIGGFVIWLCKGCKTRLKEEIRNESWLYAVVGYAAVVLFIVLGGLISLLGYE